MRPGLASALPKSTLYWMDTAPPTTAVAVLLRHAERGPLRPGDAGHHVPITEAGAQAAVELGRRMGPRLRSLRTSPVLRCMQTAERLLVGADRRLPVVPDHLLGDPGVYVHDSAVAGPLWERLGDERVVAHLVSSDELLPGLAAPGPAARFLVQHLLAMATLPGLHVFLTHDSLVTTTAARLLGVALVNSDWPRYLEGAFFWRYNGEFHAAYREWHRIQDRFVVERRA